MGRDSNKLPDRERKGRVLSANTFLQHVNSRRAGTLSASHTLVFVVPSTGPSILRILKIQIPAGKTKRTEPIF